MAEDQDSELGPTELIGIVEGTVSELKDYVKENDFSDEQLEQILSAESNSKDRKTAKKFLKKRIDGRNSEEEKAEVEPVEEVDVKETSLSREALLKMLGGTVEDVKEYVKENDPNDEELQTLLHAEKMVKDRKTVVRFLKSYSKKKELEEDFHKAETNLKELKEDLEHIEETVLEEDVELDLEEVPEPEENEESDESEEEESDEEVSDDSKESEEENNTKEEDAEEAEDESDQESSDEEESESGEEEDSEESEEEEELSELEKKKNILEDLDLELSEEEIKQISLEELEKIRQEKEKREKLIERLSAKFDREQLEKVTTKDLEKLADEVGQPDNISKQEAQRKEEEAKRQKKKDEEKMKQEAQEDLEMMMGAVKGTDDEEDDSGPSTVDQLKQLPNKFKGMLSRGGDEEENESSGFDKSKTIEVLEEYSEAEDHEATVKTAQVMKGYLEYALGIDREMTYAELAEELESRELDSENVEILIEFYRSMKISVYTGDVETDNIDEVIEASKSVVKELG